MAHSHNCLIRGLNSIVLQAPHIPDRTSPATYNIIDVQDLLKYVEAWCATVDHHHHTEETCMFPMIEEYAKEPGLMSGPHDQHAEFHPGLVKLKTYATRTRPQDFRWEGKDGMKEIIDEFAGVMMKHLHDEIDVFLSLQKMDSDSLRTCFDEGEKMAKAQGNLGMLVSEDTMYILWSFRADYRISTRCFLWYLVVVIEHTMEGINFHPYLVWCDMPSFTGSVVGILELGDSTHVIIGVNPYLYNSYPRIKSHRCDQVQ